MSKRILIVDDDVDLVDSLEAALSHKGYEVSRAHSAGEGLRRLAEVAPDLIILDVMMESDTAGFEFLYQIRKPRPESRYASFKETPVILLTAINQVTNSRFSLDQQESFLPQVEEFLTKPFKIDALLGRVEQSLEE